MEQPKETPVEAAPAPEAAPEPEPPVELDPASVRLMRLVSASDPERKHLRGGL
jgi:hypothetical protein